MSAGNVSVASAALAVTIDATAPAAPTALDLAAASDTGVSTTDNITRDHHADLHRHGRGRQHGDACSTAPPRSARGIATAAGTWSIVASSLTDGAHSITAKAADALGNISAASNALCGHHRYRGAGRPGVHRRELPRR